MATKGTKVAQKATANAGQGAKVGMTAAVYKPTAKTAGSDRVAAPVINKADIRGVSAASPKKQPMYPGKPSPGADATVKYGTGLVQGQANGRINQFSDQAGGSGRRLSKGSQKGQ